jgi:hypothetical protein
MQVGSGSSEAISRSKKKNTAIAPTGTPAEFHYSVNDVIDKASFFQQAAGDSSESSPALGNAKTERQPSNWIPTNLRPVPSFYPLEKSSRFIDDDLPSVASRLSECLRILSVQAIYNNELATAALLTMENVEMHLSLWKTTGGDYPDGIVVELQRRNGCSITFHRYSRYILDAAVGEFDFEEQTALSGEEIDRSYSRKVERMLSTELGQSPASEEENAIIAVEIAHGLLMKDRMDARQLGLESLCLLTDPRKTGAATALIASRIVLLGSQGSDEILFNEAPFQEIREKILSLVQLHRIGDEDDFVDDQDGEEALTAENEVEVDGQNGVLHNLALAVLANALFVIENYDADLKPSAVEAEAVDERGVVETFMTESSEITKRDILTSLIQELGQAEKKPHNSCLSAKCLKGLCGASAEARKRSRELGAKNIVNTALDVGVRTHAKLENACQDVLKVLTVVEDEEN